MQTLIRGFAGCVNVALVKQIFQLSSFSPDYPICNIFKKYKKYEIRTGDVFQLYDYSQEVNK